KLPKGAWLFFQMHYTPDGVARKDRSSVGLVFAKEAPKEEVRTRAITQQLFWLLPGSKSTKVASTSVFKDDTRLLTFFPHMHVRGKSFRYEATSPDGKREILLDVPNFDFNWQANYRPVGGAKLPAGTRITCTGHFDNSKENPNNPDPSKLVTWGEQTWEEM